MISLTSYDVSTFCLQEWLTIANIAEVVLNVLALMWTTSVFRFLILI